MISSLRKSDQNIKKPSRSTCRKPGDWRSEIFDKILDGQDPSVLTPYVEKMRRWTLDFWVPSLNATLALRLAFRQPEGISPLNSRRLENLLQENWRKIDLAEVRRLVQEWKMSEVMKSNLKPLRKTGKLGLLREELMG